MIEPTLTLSADDIIRLADILKTKESVLRNRVDHYRGIHEIGEATEKQQALMFEAEEDYNLALEIIRLSERAREWRATLKC